MYEGEIKKERENLNWKRKTQKIKSENKERKREKKRAIKRKKARQGEENEWETKKLEEEWMRRERESKWETISLFPLSAADGTEKWCRPMQIIDQCHQDNECRVHVPGSQCRRNYCQCQAGHRALNSTFCQKCKSAIVSASCVCKLCMQVVSASCVCKLCLQVVSDYN